MKPYKIALLTGTHQHRWPDDGSGVCEKCHKEHFPHVYKTADPGVCSICGAVGKCPHNGGFVGYSSYHQCKLCYAQLDHEKQLNSEENSCWVCPVCNFEKTGHSFSDGVCSVCGWTCPHVEFNQGKTAHRCVKCGMSFAHTVQPLGTNRTCWTCPVCGYVEEEHQLTDIGQTCSVCGLVHNVHSWSNGTCYACGKKCEHSATATTEGRCSICGMILRRWPDVLCFNSAGSPYNGSYVTTDYIEYGDGDYMEIYTGALRVDDKWVDTGYKLFEFNIRNNPTEFGGDYAYKLTGCVFTTADSVNVAPALLSASGVWNLKLAQYNLNGTLREAAMQGYTSPDCVFTLETLPEFETWTP